MEKRRRTTLKDQDFSAAHMLRQRVQAFAAIEALITHFIVAYLVIDCCSMLSCMQLSVS